MDTTVQCTTTTVAVTTTVSIISSVLQPLMRFTAARMRLRSVGIRTVRLNPILRRLITIMMRNALGF